MDAHGASSGLIVDLGMHRGDDAEFYLRKGFKVLAVEASPRLAGEASARLAGAVARGDLTILNVAVADHEGELDLVLSDNDLWSSTRADMADRGFGAIQETVRVPCTTLAKILAGYPTPHYVKIDVEGRDRDCIASLADLPEFPPFVSFEADLADPAVTADMLRMLDTYGYRRFKLVNQATHWMRRLPDPPLEGVYVDARFTKHHSGPFGEESPGPWMTLDQVTDRYLATLRQQAARIEYSAKGTVFGIPLSRLHRPIMWAYNLPLVTWVRVAWAHRRGVEVGGWFDIHAAR